MGENCYYHPFELPAEPHLVAFGDNVFVGTGVKFITHSMVNCVFNTEDGTQFKPLVGKIEIGDNVFIGANTSIMYGCTLGDNCIVAVGAVVTKSIPSGEVWGGVPACKIGNYDDVKRKVKMFNKELEIDGSETVEQLYCKQIKYFW
jgi:acetyltransferase-like isoleucine patch superfamily enzyme